MRKLKMMENMNEYSWNRTMVRTGNANLLRKGISFFLTNLLHNKCLGKHLYQSPIPKNIQNSPNSRKDMLLCVWDDCRSINELIPNSLKEFCFIKFIILIIKSWVKHIWRKMYASNCKHFSCYKHIKSPHQNKAITEVF